jgi:hypothetical protein
MKLGRIRFALVAAAAGAAHAQQATFTPIGLPGGATASGLTQVSADGAVAAGALTRPNLLYSGLRWTAQGTQLFDQRVQGLSADGQVVLLNDATAHVWSAENGVEHLGFPGGVTGVAVSGDGQSVWATSGTGVPYLWRRLSGPQAVTATIDGRPIAYSGVTDDGGFLVATADRRSPYAIARLTSVSTLEVLPDLAPGGLGSRAWITPAGVIFGRSWSPDSHFPACRWSMSGPAPVLTTEFQIHPSLASFDASVLFAGPNRIAAGQLTSIAPPVGGTSLEIRGCSADGHLAIGRSNRPGFSQDGVIWTEATGARWLRDILIGGGVNLDGWGSLGIAAVSRDGTTVVGGAINPQGAAEGFIARLP